ncbi:ribonuclease H-like protein [Heliocybe sulcata]|uniref:ribonuclease H n=1 Tax=Heliocybe sulcata TaxID=5364 RepID=A0A5C3MNZ6_9AGAM|nr:ribonuclease H-like protein [Heliocybe sulcata]
MKVKPGPVARSVQKSSVARLPQMIVDVEGEDEAGWDVVYTDGACRSNGQVGALAGIGVWWGYNDPRNLSERCPGDQTNNRAELIAIARALETAPPPPTPLLIKTDSQYSLKCFHEWLPKWLANNWRVSTGPGPVRNKPLIQYLAALLDARARAGKVRLRYVKGHSGFEGNEGADALAVAGTGLPAVEERDWDALRAGVERGMGEAEVGEKGKEEPAVEFEITENDFWEDDELAEIEREMQG